ncbi:sugar-transfer associated ATP-grasp domain-containing protein [Winogradskyella sp. UBA3174]|uniref:sugar-transfer associated ATP-grasp domain-containing protein n=1 Tax=Winogradskyella sp. UBA3174 TaxID=1947785 RepID=UPI0025CD1202|nr:sugar-transfer associated ATP-grasp domain-containing protein [Winogradskyella sp. UBA3174]|tara:strand:- start:40597 stop:41640 length:1044 start_codon:yes stop_codon:yes gene_type:complete
MLSVENRNRIKVIVKDKNKKSVFKIIKEISHLYKVKKEIPYYYFKYLYKKDATNYLDYLGASEMNLIRKSKRLHNPLYKLPLTNKLSFSQMFSATEVRTPKLISHNLENSFYYNTIETKLNNEQDFFNFFINVFDECNIEDIFLRPHSDYGGKGCFKLTRDELKQNLTSIFNLLINTNYVHNICIKQHAAINEIHKKSINTLRLISLIDSNENIKIVSALMRFGVGDSVIDNASSGGFCIGINMQDGTLHKSGVYLQEYGGKTIYKHPTSGFKLEGFKIPFFKESCEEVIKGVRALPDGFIGWDVAITPVGPVIIEANDMPHLHMSDVTFGGLLRNKDIKKLIKELK